jgi:cytochrome c biogenesis protein
VSAGAEVVQPRLGPLGWLRWTWRQLTSMRTALFLLLLLAIGAIPGSTFPQRSIDPARTAAWIADHPTAGPVLDTLGFFEVYASPWFAAIYLLLFVSLIGCVLPRTRILWHQVRSAPPRAPRRLDRLATHDEQIVDGEPEEVRERLRTALRARRYRVHAHDDETLSA